MLRILPQKFYEDPSIRKILVDGLSCVIHKKLDEPAIGKEGFLSTHAITMVLRGTLRIENDEGLFDEVPAGSMVLLPKGLYTVSDILPRDGSYEAMMFFFEPEIVQQFLDSLALGEAKEKSVTHMVMKGHADTRFFAESLLRLYGGEVQANRGLTKMKLFEWLHLVHTTHAGSDGFAAALATLNNRERRSLREFMVANCHKPLGISEYAYLTGRSVSTFTRDFKSKFGGMAPKQWLIEQRLEKARDLLTQRQIHTISDAAWESGYTNLPHFIKEFHKKYGITPKQFLIEKRNAAV
jgi:AraC-like DNA-binding protein